MKKEQAKKELLEILTREGQVIYTILKHVSASGMSRSITLCTIENESDYPCLMTLDYFTKIILDGKIDQKNGGIKVSGCGMDMGFDLVYRLSCELFNDGYKLKQVWI